MKPNYEQARDAAAEEYACRIINTLEMADARARSYKAGFDASRDYHMEIIKELMKALDDKLRERNAYAMAMKVALENGIFPDKKIVSEEIQKILSPFVEKD